MRLWHYQTKTNGVANNVKVGKQKWQSIQIHFTREMKMNNLHVKS